MSTPITPAVNPPPASYPIPAAGDGVTSANTAQYVQPLADAVAWLRSKLPGANPSGALLDIAYPAEHSQRSISVVTPLWILQQPGGAPSRQAWAQSLGGTTDSIWTPLDMRLTQGMKIAGFAADFIGNCGGSLPGTMPTLKLLKILRGLATNVYVTSDPVVTVIDTVTDTSANIGIYNTLHVVSKVMGAPETVDLATYAYYLKFTGDSTGGGAYLADHRISVSS